MSFYKAGRNKPEQYKLARELKINGFSNQTIADELKIGLVTAKTWTKDIPNTSRHFLSEIDEEQRTAICTICGPVKIVNPSQWKCVNRGRKKSVCAVSSCEICGDDAKLVYDHCHTSGNFRGWLCHHCNVGLGFFKDNPDALKKAIDYLNKT
jgi:NAD(P)H-flavin reductase